MKVKTLLKKMSTYNNTQVIISEVGATVKFVQDVIERYGNRRVEYWYPLANHRDIIVIALESEEK